MDIVKKAVKDIVSLKIQGASNVRKKAVEALLQSAHTSKAKTENEFRTEFLKNAKALFDSRPTEPELRTAIRIIKRGISKKDMSISEMKKAIHLIIDNYEIDRKNAMEKIAQYGAEMIKPDSTIITLCHSSTVVKMLIKAKKKISKVYCCETRPLYQGRITARELASAGINTTLIVDNAASTVLKECDYFFTGTDAFLADGDVINKIGTSQLSTLCKKYDVKHYAVTSTHKFEPQTFFGKDEPIEHRNPTEIITKKDKDYSNKVSVLNPAFDRTDSNQVEGIICEIGIITPQTLAAMLYEKLDLGKHEKEFLKL
ncbi:MAG: S-methyl-5-thioribose-1-phosphate isomerase [archaeon]|jgi:ribose 1,5-bisphosphate isomerase